MAETFEEISPADFFYRNRDIAGFTNPARAIFSSVRELVENALDASDLAGVPPEIYIRVSYEGESGPEAAIYKLMVKDNGSGVPARHIPSAFGQVLFGSKFKLRQTRGTFGLGGKMAILYGQITTHKPAYVTSSKGTSKIHTYKLMIDIQRNRPIILDRKIQANHEQWRGTVVEFYLEGDYFRAMPKILEYLKQTAVVTPYANITFVDPKGRLYKFNRVVTKMPPPPRETLPHPHGVDVETIQRLTRITECRNMLDFMQKHFHRVNENIADRFLKFVETMEIIQEIEQKLTKAEMGPGKEALIQEIKQRLIETKAPEEAEPVIKEVERKLAEAGIPEAETLIQLIRQKLINAPQSFKYKNPSKLKPHEIVKLVQGMKKFEEFRPPASSCLSPLGEELLKIGILKELRPEFVAVCQREPSSYSGHPFIVEVGIAYGGEIPRKNDFVLYRFANRIPLLYDEASDVSWKAIKSINWRRYKITSDMPIAIITHICSTKVPYKTVGKEFISDRPEVNREILNGLREAGRQLKRFLSKQEYIEKEKKRLTVFSKYLPKIAQFSTELAEKEKPPDIEKLLRSVKTLEEGD